MQVRTYLRRTGWRRPADYPDGRVWGRSGWNVAVPDRPEWLAACGVLYIVAMAERRTEAQVAASMLGDAAVAEAGGSDG